MQYEKHLYIFWTVQAHMYNDLIKTYEAKLLMFGVPSEELGFRPLKSMVAGQTGLVASPS